jgi:hypothetical protein
MSKVNMGSSWKPEPLHKRTAQSKKVSSVKLSSMNKAKKRSYKPYRGQG